MKLKLTNKEIYEFLEVESPEFPRYTTQLVNLANQNAQGTRPKVVGQMSELIRLFRGRKIDEWEEWYSAQHPDAIEVATKKILAMLERLREALGKIDGALVEKWVKDLVVMKTFVGLRFQEAILKRIAQLRDSTYRLATPEEESKGIDGFIGTKAISIKPITYKLQSRLSEGIPPTVIYYEKRKDGLLLYLEDD